MTLKMILLIPKKAEGHTKDPTEDQLEVVNLTMRKEMTIWKEHLVVSEMIY